MVLNEKVFRRGRETKALPVLMIVGASNHLPEDEALQALFDRFLIRVHCDNVDPESLEQVLEAGWKLEGKKGNEMAQISAEQISQVQSLIASVDLQDIRTAYMELIGKLRNAGIALSDRRAVKLQRLIAASALLCKRTKAIASDMWVLRYIWDSEEQQEVIAGIVNSVVEADKEPSGQHPRASVNALPNADDIFKEVAVLSQKWQTPETSMAERTIIKDRLRYLNGRCQWLDNEVQRLYVQQPIDELWQKILHTA
jgi:MoxR-like ATPase